MNLPIALLICLCWLKSVNCFYVIIETGFVGVRYSWGKIRSTVLHPGLHFYNPMSDNIVQMETRPQKDILSDVDCMSNEGLRLVFENIEIGNQLNESFVIETASRFGPHYDNYLVTDLVRHQINVICSKQSANELAITKFSELDDLLKEFIQEENDKQSTGLTINFVRLTKPRMPPSVEKNYLALAEEKTLKQVLEEKKIRKQTEKETEMIVAIKDNEIKLQNAANANNMMVLNMKAKQEEQVIRNEMIIAEAKATAAKTQMEAEALLSMYNIPGYAEVQIANAMSNNQKIYYGDRLPQYTLPVLPTPVSAELK